MIYVPATATKTIQVNAILYTLTVIAPVNPGYTDPYQTTQYPAGTVVTINATPESGYVFAGWKIDGLAPTGSAWTTITMNSNHSIQAVFTAILYTLTVIAPVNPGYVNPVPGSYQYPYGTVVTVDATPESGYLFTGWLIDGSSTPTGSNYIPITMSGNRSIKPVFTAIPPTPTTLTLVAVDTVETNTPFTISGKLTNSTSGAGISGKTIVVSIDNTQVANPTTDSSGNYSITTSITTTGTKTLKSVFAGGALYLPSIAESSLGATAGEAPPIPTWVIVGSVGLAVVVGYFMIRKKRKK